LRQVDSLTIPWDAAAGLGSLDADVVEALAEVPEVGLRA
jgi:hypothetical protein